MAKDTLHNCSGGKLCSSAEKECLPTLSGSAGTAAALLINHQLCSWDEPARAGVWHQLPTHWKVTENTQKLLGVLENPCTWNCIKKKPTKTKENTCKKWKYICICKEKSHGIYTVLFLTARKGANKLSKQDEKTLCHYATMNREQPSVPNLKSKR